MHNFLVGLILNLKQLLMVGPVLDRFDQDVKIHVDVWGLDRFDSLDGVDSTSAIVNLRFIDQILHGIAMVCKLIEAAARILPSRKDPLHVLILLLVVAEIRNFL